MHWPFEWKIGLVRHKELARALGDQPNALLPDISAEIQIKISETGRSNETPGPILVSMN
jgi:hypothetical protein